MTKKILLFTLLIISISCATKSKVVENKPDKKVRVIEDAGTLTGRKAPEWLSMNTISEIKKLYSGKMPFRTELSGANINLLRRRVNTTTLNAEFSRVISTAILATANDLMKGKGSDKILEVDDFKASDSINTRAQVSGFMREGDWWQRVEYDGKEEYRYYVLYLIDEDRFNSILSGTIRDPEVVKKIGDDISQALEDNIESVTKAYEATSFN